MIGHETRSGANWAPEGGSNAQSLVGPLQLMLELGDGSVRPGGGNRSLRSETASSSTGRADGAPKSKEHTLAPAESCCEQLSDSQQSPCCRKEILYPALFGGGSR